MSTLEDFFGRPIGCFSTLFPGGVEERARAMAGHGFSCVQWTTEESTEKLTAELMEEESKAFAEQGLKVVAVSGYQNMVAPDPVQKRDCIARLKRLLELAPVFGPGMGVATETGTKNPDNPWKFSPKNLDRSTWSEMVGEVASLAKQAQRHGSRLLIEGYVENVARTVDDLNRLMDALPEANLGFVMDPFNLILEERVADHQKELPLIFSAIKDRTPVAHAKDLIYHGGEVDTPRAGAGIFDYIPYFRLLDAHLPGLPLVLEHLKPEEVTSTLDYLKQCYLKAGQGTK